MNRWDVLFDAFAAFEGDDVMQLSLHTDAGADALVEWATARGRGVRTYDLTSPAIAPWTAHKVEIGERAITAHRSSVLVVPVDTESAESPASLA